MSEMSEAERIARLLCAADGCDPDMLVLPTYEPQTGPFGRKIIAAPDLTVAWRLYQNYVQATLDAADGTIVTPSGVAVEAVPAGSWRDRYHL